MRTTVDLPEDLLEELVRVTGATTRREALITAMRDVVRRHKLAALAASAGTLDLDDVAPARARGRRRMPDEP